jgi:hypothetical protein
MVNQMSGLNGRTERRPFLIEVDSYNSASQRIKKHKFLIPGPIGGSFKVSNGKILADITINELGVIIKTIDESGKIKIISTD